MTILGPVGQGPVHQDNGGFVGMVGFGAVCVAGWSLFSLFWVSIFLGAAALGFVAFCIWMLTRIDPLPQPRKGVAISALLLAPFGVVLVYPLVFDSHVVTFPLAGWTIAGLLAIGLTTAWSVVTTLMRVIALLLGTALTTYLVIFPTPSGAGDPDDDANDWKIELTVVDETGAALKDALAQCEAVMFWNKDVPLNFDLSFRRRTDDAGHAEFTFREDTRLKVAVCSAMKERDQPMSWRAPEDDEIASAVYPERSAVMASPLPGGDYKMTLRLERRPSP